MISAIILYGQESDKKLLEKCLRSVAWADEVIKINGIEGNFSDWRNEGFRKAKGDWILYVDSDEMVSEDLRYEIERETKKPKFSAYAIPRRNIILGKEFKYSGQWPDYQKRLFLKSALQEWSGQVHEEPLFKGVLGKLQSPLIHHKHDNITDMLTKTNKWSEIEAGLLFEAGHPEMNIIRFASAGFREFWLRMIRQTAFLDGKEGIIYALYQVFSKLITYSKLWEKQQS